MTKRDPGASSQPENPVRNSSIGSLEKGAESDTKDPPAGFMGPMFHPSRPKADPGETFYPYRSIAPATASLRAALATISPQNPLPDIARQSAEERLAEIGFIAERIYAVEPREERMRERAEEAAIAWKIARETVDSREGWADDALTEEAADE